MAKAYTFLPPSMMIDYTRHNHNEMVLERRKNTNTDGEISKRLPNYIVYFVEDMGESNFSEKMPYGMKQNKRQLILKCQ